MYMYVEFVSHIRSVRRLANRFHWYFGTGRVGLVGDGLADGRQAVRRAGVLGAVRGVHRIPAGLQAPQSFDSRPNLFQVTSVNSTSNLINKWYSTCG